MRPISIVALKQMSSELIPTAQSGHFSSSLPYFYFLWALLVIISCKVLLLNVKLHAINWLFREFKNYMTFECKFCRDIGDIGAQKNILLKPLFVLKIILPSKIFCKSEHCRIQLWNTKKKKKNCSYLLILPTVSFRRKTADSNIHYQSEFIPDYQMI